MLKMKSMVKSILSLIVASLLIATVAPEVRAETKVQEKSVSVTKVETVFDDETKEDIQALEEIFDDPALLQNTIRDAGLVGLQSETIKTKAGTTVAIKATLKALLKNKNKLFNLVETWGGKRAAKSLKIRFNKYVEPVIKDLLKYESLAWGLVEGNIASALYDTGIKKSSARTIAYWVVKIAQWFF